jgi:phenylacetate-CoA ligase
MSKDHGSMSSAGMTSWILENVVFRSGDAILQTSFVPALKRWREVSTYDERSLAALQRKNLKALLLYLSESNRYYRNLLPDASTVLNGDPAAVLKSLPILDKEIIRNNLDDLVSDPFVKNRHKLILEKSSGSSGVQGSVYMSRAEAYNVSAAQTHLWEWAGYRLGRELLQLGMTTDRGLIKSLKDHFSNTTYKPAFQIDGEDVKRTLGQFENRGDAFFGGYASGLYSYATIAEQSGLKTKFRSVISWGDKMFPHYRKKIERTFDTRVFDTYGCTEGMMIAGQCELGTYHVLSPHVYLELLDDDGHEVPPGHVGKVVVTRLDGRSFPLVRYKLGDLAARPERQEPCGCGRHYPQLAMVVGRDTDIVVTPKGNPLIVHFFTGIFEHEQDIKQFRIVQHENRDLLVEYVTDREDHDPVLDRLRERMNHNSGEELPLTFKRVGSIPPTKSGKPQIVLSLLKNRFIPDRPGIPASVTQHP